MINFTTQLTYSNYFWANYYRFSETLIDKLMPLLALFCVISFTILGYWPIGLFFLLLPIITFFVIPLIKYLYAKFYLHVNTIDYFFNTETFGYKIGSYKIEIDKKVIRNISFRKKYMKITAEKQTLYFVTEGDTQDLYRQFLSSTYSAIIKH